MSTVNIVGLVACLFGIIVHVIMKATASSEYEHIHDFPNVTSKPGQDPACF